MFRLTYEYYLNQNFCFRRTLSQKVAHISFLPSSKNYSHVYILVQGLSQKCQLARGWPQERSLYQNITSLPNLSSKSEASKSKYPHTVIMHAQNRIIGMATDPSSPSPVTKIPDLVKRCIFFSHLSPPCRLLTFTAKDACKKIFYIVSTTGCLLHFCGKQFHRTLG